MSEEAIAIEEAIEAMCPYCENRKEHPKCEACGIIIGENHLEAKLYKYRDHHLCNYCLNTWERHPNKNWQQFAHPNSPKNETIFAPGKEVYHVD